MKRTVFLIMILLLCFSVKAEVVFVQVLFDPLLTESGGEAILLWNRGNESISLDEWTIETESSARDVVFENVLLGSGEYLLIADTGWSEKKDNMSWPDADIENTITMKNSDSYVALVDANGSVVDYVCWGLVNRSDCVENVDSGEMVLRQFFTGNNSIDYLITHAEFFDFDVRGIQGISVELTVAEDIYSIDDIEIILPDDDPLKEGIQISPYPGEIREIEIEMNHNASVYFSSKELTERVLELDPAMEPGMYEIEAHYDGEVRTVEFEYMELAGLAMDSDQLVIDSLSVIGDEDFATGLFPTIKNIGNVPLKVGVKATDFISEQNIIDVSSIYFSIADEVKQARRIVDVFSSVVGVDSTVPFGIEFRGNIKKGQYKGDIYIAGVRA